MGKSHEGQDPGGGFSFPARTTAEIAGGPGMEIFLVPNFQEAKKELSRPGSYDLVFADAELPDGSWRDLLQLLIDSSRHCELIVCSRVGDERSEEHTSELQSLRHLVCRLLLE